MKRQKRKKRDGGRLFLAFVIAVSLLTVLWLGAQGMEKLLHYGESATISKPEEEDPEGITHTAEETQGLVYGVPTNPYAPEGFSEENGYLTYEKNGIVGRLGVDVSSHQQEIDWEKVKAAGVEFAIIRAGYRGYTKGQLVEDEYFKKNMEGAAAAGLDVGVYFFSQAISVEEAAEEADFVLGLVEGYGFDLQYPIFFDWEDVEADARSDVMNKIALTGCAFSFCARIEETGHRAGIYFNQKFGYQELNLFSLLDYDFWLAEYNPVPSFQYSFGFWQYTNCGKVDGINTDVDLNLAFEKK